MIQDFLDVSLNDSICDPHFFGEGLALSSIQIIFMKLSCSVIFELKELLMLYILFVGALPNVLLVFLNKSTRFICLIMIRLDQLCSSLVDITYDDIG